ncbi:MAG: hypothetical protein V1930_09845 [Pseudomonadota bacterium]
MTPLRDHPVPLPLDKNRFWTRVKESIAGLLRLILFGSLIWAMWAGPVFAQTTLVAIRTPQEIWIGADSKVNLLLPKAVSRSGCKIRQVGNFFIGYAGLAEYTKTNYDLVTLVNEACMKGGTLEDKVRAFDGVIVNPLSHALKYIKRTHSRYYRQKIHGKAAVQIVFAAVEEGVPIIHVRYLNVSDRGGDSPSIALYKRSCPGEDCPNGEFVAYLGHNEAIVRFVEKEKNFWTIGYAEGIRELIDLEIQAEPDYVGAPIDILRLDGKGHRWIQRKEECR